MKIIVDNDLNDVFINYEKNNYNSISIITKIVIKKDKKYYKTSIDMNKIKDYNNNIHTNNSKEMIINFIINDFIAQNNFISKEISYNNLGTYIRLVNTTGKELTISSPFIEKQYPNIIEKISNIRIVKNDLYKMIDNNEINNIQIYFNKSEFTSSKTFIYRKNLKKLIFMVNTFNYEELDEIKYLIEYFINKNNDYLQNSIELTDITNQNHYKMYKLRDNKEIFIKGKEFINYLEGNEKNEKNNNGKNSKCL
jgi:hypothetical protein